MRFGNWVVLTILWAMAPVSGPGAEAVDWLERSRTILTEAARQPPPAWLRRTPPESAVQAARQIAREAGSEPQRVERSVALPGTVLIFASFAVPELTLKNLLSQAAQPDVTLVLRGLPEGASLPETLRRLRRLVPDSDPVPNVVLDPTLFRRFNIQAAPTLVLLRAEQSPVIVRGAVTVDWLREHAGRLRPTDSSHLGGWGETFEIAEADLIEVMQRRLAAIDWRKRREAAIAKFWRDKNDFVDLPTARESHTFTVDPTYPVPKAVRDANGHELVRAGEVFNPLHRVPMTKTVIVFRGTDARQLKRVADLARQIRREGRGVVLITTHVDRDKGWRSLEALETDLQGPVFILPPTLAARFQLRRVPSVIEARGERLWIREIGMGAS